MPASARSLLLSSAVCVVLFSVLFGGVYYTDAGRWLDNAALDGFLATMSPGWVPEADAFARLLNPLPYAVWTAAIVATGLLRRAPRRAAAALVLLGGSAVTTQFLKPALAEWRFDGSLVGFDHAVPPVIVDAAFPSGHATAAMAVALAAVIVAPRALRPLVASLGALFALAIGFTLVALAWHFPSDIVGGYLVATTWCLLALAALRAADARWPERGTLRAAANERAPALRQAFAPAAVLIGAAGVGVGLARVDRLAEFAGAHTSAALAAMAISLCATALVAAVTLADQRGR
jgi:membrane-associated phospholipid phosphatase